MNNIFAKIGGHSKSTFAQDSRVLTSPPPRFFTLVHFQAQHPPPHPPWYICFFVLAGTHPLPLNFYTCEI